MCIFSSYRKSNNYVENSVQVLENNPEAEPVSMRTCCAPAFASTDLLPLSGSLM